MLIQALDLIWKTLKKTLASILYLRNVFFFSNQIFLNAIVIILQMYTYYKHMTVIKTKHFF